MRAPIHLAFDCFRRRFLSFVYQNPDGVWLRTNFFCLDEEKSGQFYSKQINWNFFPVFLINKKSFQWFDSMKSFLKQVFVWKKKVKQCLQKHCKLRSKVHNSTGTRFSCIMFCVFINAVYVQYGFLVSVDSINCNSRKTKQLMMWFEICREGYIQPQIDLQFRFAVLSTGFAHLFNIVYRSYLFVLNKFTLDKWCDE